MKIIQWVSVALCASSLVLVGCSPRENDVIVLEVGPTKVPLGEYERFFTRNTGGVEAGKSSTAEDREHFLDLLTNYKLKLLDAYDRNLQNDPEILQELRDYRSSLAATFLIDKEVTEPGIKVMFDRKHEDIRAQHILLSLKNSASPNDTLAAWTKAQDIIRQVRAGENFDSLALKYSNDPTVKSNRGDLYYFTGGQMAVAFENAVYSMKKGEIGSFPVRSSLGYHIIKILDRIPSRGSMKVSHIMARFKVSETDSTDNASALQGIHAVQDSLKRGWDFAKLAMKFSEDPGSAPAGGDLGWFERRRWVQPFDEACFKLNSGQTSEIVKTPYGYHVIHCDSVMPVSSLSELHEELKKHYQQNRYTEEYAAFIAGLKREYHYSFSDETFSSFASHLDSMKSVGDSAWSDAVPQDIRKQTLVRINGTSYPLDSIISIFNRRSDYRNTLLRRTDLRPRIDRVAENLLLDEKSAGLEKRDPEFASLMNEYESGIVLFKAEQLEVWNKVAVTDSILKTYFDQNRSSFMFPKRVGFSEIHVSSDTLALLIYDSLTHNADFGALAALYNEDPDARTKKGARGLKPINSDELTTLAAGLKMGEISEPVELQTGGYSIIKVTQREQPRQKTFQEAGAEVSNQCQEFLSKQIEQQWIDRIKQRYPVKQYRERLRAAFGSRQASH